MKENRLRLVKRYILLGQFKGGYQYFWFPYIFFNIFVNVGQLIYLYLVWGDLNKMVGIFATLTVEFQTTYKLMLLYWHSKKILRLASIVDDEFWDYEVSGPQLEKKLNGRMKLVLAILLVHFWGSIAGCFVYMAFPLTKYPPGVRALPIQSWFPFDTNPSPLHEVVYFLLGSNGILCVVAIGIFDFSFVYFAQHLLAQFEVLKYRLERVTETARDVQEEDPMRIYDDGFQRLVYRRLSVCIAHHAKLLSFGHEIEKYCSVSIAIQLIVSMMTFVIIGFILSSNNEDLVKSLKLAIYFWVISLQLIIFAIHGSELQSQSCSVSDAAYFCRWYLGKESLRRGLVLLQMNALKEIKISAAGLMDLNNNTLVLVYRTAFSCVTLLQSMNED